MKIIFRAFVTFVCGVAAFYSVSFLVLWAEGAGLSNMQLPAWVSLVVALGACIIVGRYVWSRTGLAQRGMATSIVMGALIVGGIGFAAGFFGPVIFMPDNNLGPLLGLFTTGPWGCVVGGVGGFVYWFLRRKSEKPSQVEKGD